MCSCTLAENLPVSNQKVHLNLAPAFISLLKDWITLSAVLLDVVGKGQNNMHNTIALQESSKLGQCKMQSTLNMRQTIF